MLAPHVKDFRGYLGFFHSLLSSSSHEVAALAILASHDRRSNLGANLTHLKELTKLDPWAIGRDQLILQEFLIQRLSARYDGIKGEEERLTTLIDSLNIN